MTEHDGFQLTGCARQKERLAGENGQRQRDSGFELRQQSHFDMEPVVHLAVDPEFPKDSGGARTVYSQIHGEPFFLRQRYTVDFSGGIQIENERSAVGGEVVAISIVRYVP